MRFYFLWGNDSALADPASAILRKLKDPLLEDSDSTVVLDPRHADAILIQERISFKDFRYINKLLSDPVIGRYPEKVYTINGDDCATGLLRGLYTSLPRARFNPDIHAVVPFMDYPNTLISVPHEHDEPVYLAAWRGNTKSNSLRSRMMTALKDNAAFSFETTDSWMNHGADEMKAYVDMILNARFSLCPAGWAPVTFRIYESMALGRCPVILADNFVAPAGPDWNSFALFYPERKYAGIEAFLNEHRDEYKVLGNNAFNAWTTYFGPSNMTRYYAQALLPLLHRPRTEGRAAEIKRWRSLPFYWSNRWTIPQRVMNKVSKLSSALTT